MWPRIFRTATEAGALALAVEASVRQLDAPPVPTLDTFDKNRFIATETITGASLPCQP